MVSERDPDPSPGESHARGPCEEAPAVGRRRRSLFRMDDDRLRREMVQQLDEFLVRLPTGRDAVDRISSKYRPIEIMLLRNPDHQPTEALPGG